MKASVNDHVSLTREGWDLVGAHCSAEDNPGRKRDWFIKRGERRPGMGRLWIRRQWRGGWVGWLRRSRRRQGGLEARKRDIGPPSDHL